MFYICLYAMCDMLHLGFYYKKTNTIFMFLRFMYQIDDRILTIFYVYLNYNFIIDTGYVDQHKSFRPIST